MTDELYRRVYDKRVGRVSDIRSFREAVASETGGIVPPKEAAERWLLSQEPSYALFRKRKKRIFRTTQVYYKFHQIQCDLLELSTAERDANDNYRYIFIIVEALTRYVWLYPLYDKRAVSTAQALEKFLLSTRAVPAAAFLDRGREFEGAFARLASNFGIRLEYSNDVTKASLSERAIRSIRELITRLQSFRKSLRFLDDLGSIVRAYNLRPHRSIGGVSPHHALYKLSSEQVFRRLYRGRKNFHFDFQEALEKQAFHLGDRVRLATVKPLLKKKTRQTNWTEEIFVVAKVLYRHPEAVYLVKDANGQVLRGSFHASELLAVPPPAPPLPPPLPRPQHSY